MMNYVSIIQRQLKSMQKDFFAVIGLSWELDLKRSGTELTMANQMDLGIERRRKCCRISQDPVIRCSVVPAPWREDNWEAKKEERQQFTSTEVRKILSCSSTWSSLSNQLSLYGAVADMIEEFPVGQNAPAKPVASGQLEKQKFLTQLLLAELQANEEREGNLLQEYEQRFEKLSEDQKLSRLCSEAGLRVVVIGQFFYALPSPWGEGNQSLCREFSLPRDQKGTRTKGWNQSTVRFEPVSDIKVCNEHRGYSIEIQVQSLFQGQTVFWIRIVNGIDKFVREAMPIQEEEKASQKPATKARPILKPSSTSGWDFTPMEQRQWFDIERQESKDFLWFWSVKIHHSVASTQSKSLSRSWWSSPSWPCCWWMQE